MSGQAYMSRNAIFPGKTVPAVTGSYTGKGTFLFPVTHLLQDPSTVQDTIPGPDTVTSQTGILPGDSLSADSLPPGTPMTRQGTMRQDTVVVRETVPASGVLLQQDTVMVQKMVPSTDTSTSLYAGRAGSGTETGESYYGEGGPDAKGTPFTSSIRPEENRISRVAPEGADRAILGHPGWVFFYLFLLLSVYAWVRIQFGNILTKTFQASTNFNVATRMFQDNSMLQNQLDSILYGFYFLSLSFFIYFTENWWGLHPYGLHGTGLLLFNMALLLGVFMGRAVVVSLAGFLFNRSKLFREYLYNSFIFNKLIGIVVVPLMVLTVYTTGTLQQILFWFTLGSVGIVILLRVARGVVFSFRKGVLIFYMFLYLCALELVPLLFLYRWLYGIL